MVVARSEAKFGVLAEKEGVKGGGALGEVAEGGTVK